MSAVTVDVRIADAAWETTEDLPGLAQRAVAIAAGFLDIPIDGEVAILLTDDGEMQRLNRDWRGKDKPTDVLSFPADGHDPRTLGDLALGHGVCARDAAALAIAFESHVSHLIIHGFFHLFGHDHEEDEDARIMESLEVAALARLGLHDPYSLGTLSDGND